MAQASRKLLMRSTAGLGALAVAFLLTPTFDKTSCDGPVICFSVEQAAAKGGIKKIFNKHAKGINKSIKGPGSGQSGQNFKLGEKGKLSKIFNGKSGAAKPGGSTSFKGAPGTFKLGQNGKLTKVFNKQATGPTASQANTSQVKFKLGEKGKLTKVFNGAKPTAAAGTGKSSTQFKLGEKGKLTKTFNTQSGAQPPKSPPPTGTKFKMGEKGKLTPIFNKAAKPK